MPELIRAIRETPEQAGQLQVEYGIELSVRPFSVRGEYRVEDLRAYLTDAALGSPKPLAFNDWYTERDALCAITRVGEEAQEATDVQARAAREVEGHWRPEKAYYPPKATDNGE